MAATSNKNTIHNKLVCDPSFCYFSLFPLSIDRNPSLGDGLVNSEKLEAKEEKNKVSLIVILDLLCCL